MQRIISPIFEFATSVSVGFGPKSGILLASSAATKSKARMVCRHRREDWFHRAGHDRQESGQVAYAVLRFGGFLGIGSDYYPIPWASLNYDTSLGGYRTTITEQQLQVRRSTQAIVGTGTIASVAAGSTIITVRRGTNTDRSAGRLPTGRRPCLCYEGVSCSFRMARLPSCPPGGVAVGLGCHDDVSPKERREVTLVCATDLGADLDEGTVGFGQ